MSGDVTGFRRGESGYSLVEVLVSIVILSIAVIPMVTMLDSGLRASTTSGDYDRARTLTNSNIERIKASGFAGAESVTACPVAPPSGFTCTVSTSYQKLVFSGGSASFTAASASDPKNILRVTVGVTWRSNSFAQSAVVAR